MHDQETRETKAPAASARPQYYPCSYREQYKRYEADFKQFGNRQEWTSVAGFPCLAVRCSSGGDWCGYLGVPRGHVLYGVPYQQIDGGSVHGGFTYSGHRTELKDDQGQRYWWFGFDCGHLGDWALQTFDVTPQPPPTTASLPLVKPVMIATSTAPPKRMTSPLPLPGQDPCSGEFRDFAYIQDQLHTLSAGLVTGKIRRVVLDGL